MKIEEKLLLNNKIKLAKGFVVKETKIKQSVVFFILKRDRDNFIIVLFALYLKHCHTI